MAPHTGAKRYAGCRIFFSTGVMAPVAHVESAPMADNTVPVKNRIKHANNGKKPPIFML